MSATVKWPGWSSSAPPPAGSRHDAPGAAFVDPDASSETVVDTFNRGGKPTRVRLSCSAFHATSFGVTGAMLLMEVVPR